MSSPPGLFDVHLETGRGDSFSENASPSRSLQPEPMKNSEKLHPTAAQARYCWTVVDFFELTPVAPYKITGIFLYEKWLQIITTIVVALQREISYINI